MKALKLMLIIVIVFTYKATATNEISDEITNDIPQNNTGMHEAVPEPQIKLSHTWNYTSSPEKTESPTSPTSPKKESRLERFVRVWSERLRGLRRLFKRPKTQPIEPVNGSPPQYNASSLANNETTSNLRVGSIVKPEHPNGSSDLKPSNPKLNLNDLMQSILRNIVRY